MKWMSSGHDKSALFFGYGVKSHQTVSRFSHRQNRMRDERPLVVDEHPYLSKICKIFITYLLGYTWV